MHVSPTRRYASTYKGNGSSQIIDKQSLHIYATDMENTWSIPTTKRKPYVWTGSG